jgi:predicted dehydrogenase
VLNIAIVGCGKIADQHAEQISFISNCRIVAVCDPDELMAEQLQERLNVPASFTDIRELLDRTTPDVVHITSPPQSHLQLGMACLEAGCNVYIEKPFTLNAAEAEVLINLAERRNLKLTVGHNAQFSHAAMRMRQLVNDGYLGGPPIHLESYYCYDLGDSYARAVLGDRQHWVNMLPGGLLQNTISHGVSKIAEFLASEDPEVIAYGFTSPHLKSKGETHIIDELRVLVHDCTTTAYFTFSSQMRPAVHQLRVYGPRNGLIVDHTQQTVIKVDGSAYKSYLEQFIPPWKYAKQYVGQSLKNMERFLNADFQAGYGMKMLINRFYQSIATNRPVPIPYEEILRNARIMDAIVSQLDSRQSLSRKGEATQTWSGREGRGIAL